MSLVAAAGALAWGCTRTSAPPPASDAAAPAPPSPASVDSQPQPAATSPASALPTSEPAPAASAQASAAPAPAAPAPAAPVSANPWTTPHVCSKPAAAPDQPPEQRKRSQTTCAAKEEFRSFVAARQACTAASQCSVIVGSCPFGCFVPVATAAVSEVKAKQQTLDARLDQAGARCMYRCMNPPAAACVDGRCSTAAP
jgi:hypothetical protein